MTNTSGLCPGVVYLTNKLDELFPGFKLLYKNSSAFIHFSDQHLHLNTDKKEDENNFIMYIRLSEISEISIDKKVDYAFNMFFVGKELNKLLEGYKISNENFLKRIFNNK